MAETSINTRPPTARISGARWREDAAWNRKNPDGRLRAIWYPRAGRIDLIRLSGPDCLEFPGGMEVNYPALGDAVTWTVDSDPEPETTIVLQWV
jgi:hypothetical protein